jgi:hypothetical protein
MSSSRTPGDDDPIDDLDALERELAADAGDLDDDEDDDELDDELDEQALDDLDGAEMSEQELLAELDAARRRLSEVPAAQVVANHAMGLFELGAIHLGTSPPSLGEAALAIDALGILVDGLGDRLGEAAPTLRAALEQIRLAYVQVKAAATAP